jgi:hypothetical protein
MKGSDLENEIHDPLITGIKTPQIRNPSKRKNNGISVKRTRDKILQIPGIPESQPRILPRLPTKFWK